MADGHRSIKELLELMIANQSLFELGLCHWATELWCNKNIGDYEYSLLTSYINRNKVDNHFDRGYYWEPGDLAPRIKWINEHIKKNSK